uniref:Uncharacterized protein n=1 Tax=Rhizophora mucronata TaxID=61149 RepID=A0A2P2Q0H0_RHIMU
MRITNLQDYLSKILCRLCRPVDRDTEYNRKTGKPIFSCQFYITTFA